MKNRTYFKSNKLNNEDKYPSYSRPKIISDIAYIPEIDGEPKVPAKKSHIDDGDVTDEVANDGDEVINVKIAASQKKRKIGYDFLFIYIFMKCGRIGMMSPYHYTLPNRYFRDKEKFSKIPIQENS